MVKIDGKNVVITLPISEQVSKSGKTILIATTNGFTGAGIEHNGKPVSVSVNVCIPRT